MERGVWVFRSPSERFGAVSASAPRQGWGMQQIAQGTRFDGGKGLRGEVVVVARYRSRERARAACEKEKLFRQASRAIQVKLKSRNRKATGPHTKMYAWFLDEWAATLEDRVEIAVGDRVNIFGPDLCPVEDLARRLGDEHPCRFVIAPEDGASVHMTIQKNDGSEFACTSNASHFCISGQNSTANHSVHSATSNKRPFEFNREPSNTSSLSYASGRKIAIFDAASKLSALRSAQLPRRSNASVSEHANGDLRDDPIRDDWRPSKRPRGGRSVSSAPQRKRHPLQPFWTTLARVEKTRNRANFVVCGVVLRQEIARLLQRSRQLKTDLLLLEPPLLDDGTYDLNIPYNMDDPYQDNTWDDPYAAVSSSSSSFHSSSGRDDPSVLEYWKRCTVKRISIFKRLKDEDYLPIVSDSGSVVYVTGMRISKSYIVQNGSSEIHPGIDKKAIVLRPPCGDAVFQEVSPGVTRTSAVEPGSPGEKKRGGGGCRLVFPKHKDDRPGSDHDLALMDRLLLWGHQFFRISRQASGVRPANDPRHGLTNLQAVFSATGGLQKNTPFSLLCKVVEVKRRGSEMWLCVWDGSGSGCDNTETSGRKYLGPKARLSATGTISDSFESNGSKRTRITPVSTVSDVELRSARGAGFADIYIADHPQHDHASAQKHIEAMLRSLQPRVDQGRTDIWFWLHGCYLSDEHAPPAQSINEGVSSHSSTSALQIRLSSTRHYGSIAAVARDSKALTEHLKLSCPGLVRALHEKKMRENRSSTSSDLVGRRSRELSSSSPSPLHLSGSDIGSAPPATDQSSALAKPSTGHHAPQRASEILRATTVLDEEIRKNVPLVALHELIDGSIWRRSKNNDVYVACRVRASVRAFWPKDVRDFSTEAEQGKASPGAYVYRVGFKLVSSESPDCSVDATLSNSDAAHFFGDIRAQNLWDSESRGVAGDLASRMCALMHAEASEIEFAVKAYRPGKDDGTEEGRRRFRIYGTRLTI